MNEVDERDWHCSTCKRQVPDNLTPEWVWIHARGARGPAGVPLDWWGHRAGDGPLKLL